MSFDAWIVAFGLSGLLRQMHLVNSGLAYLVFVAVAVLDIWMLYRFFAAPAVTDATLRQPTGRDPATDSPG